MHRLSAPFRITCKTSARLKPHRLLKLKVPSDELVEVTVYEPSTIAATTLLLTLTAATACWIPARGAGRVDPLVAFGTNYRQSVWRHHSTPKFLVDV